MKTLVAFGRFWYDFVIGDDWRIAVGVVLAIILTEVLSHNDITAWWVLPTAVIGLLGMSLGRHETG
jgi:hypothetical protein